MKPRRTAETALIFDWHRKEARGPWLAAFFLLTVIGIASLFLLFRIVTPDAPRMIARPQQMILLNPDVPADRALIHRAMDRSFTLLPNESPTYSSLPSVAAIPEFRPGMRGFEMKLKNLGSQRLNSDDNAPLQVMSFDDILPPLPTLPPPAATQEERPARLRLQVRASSGRKLSAEAAWQDIPLTDPEHVTFRLGVDPQGRVILALPLNASDEPAIMEQLRAALGRVRFEPIAGKAGGVDWVEAGFYWTNEKEAAP